MVVRMPAAAPLVDCYELSFPKVPAGERDQQTASRHTGHEIAFESAADSIDRAAPIEVQFIRIGPEIGPVIGFRQQLFFAGTVFFESKRAEEMDFGRFKSFR
ncbi:hypothetical protein AUQ37_07970 [Candidatus Methanomethylophilus sp. 1R26]|nr:hypothetical protein AUQ37_07970 [Candidatus Methanomethylophilus sp. 1R26]